MVQDSSEEGGHCPTNQSNPQRVFFVFNKVNLSGRVSRVVKSHLRRNPVQEVPLGMGVNHVPRLGDLDREIGPRDSPFRDRRPGTYIPRHDGRAGNHCPRHPRDKHDGAENESDNGGENQFRSARHIHLWSPALCAGLLTVPRARLRTALCAGLLTPHLR